MRNFIRGMRHGQLSSIISAFSLSLLNANIEVFVGTIKKGVLY